MANEANWLIKLFKKTGRKNLLIKSFYKTLNGKVWDDANLKGAAHAKSYAYIKLCNNISEEQFDGAYLYAKKEDDMPAALIELEFPFKHAGTMVIPLEKLSNDAFDELCKAIFIQLMMLVSKGWGIYLGMHSYCSGKQLIKPYTEEISLVECDICIE